METAAMAAAGGRVVGVGAKVVCESGVAHRRACQLSSRVVLGRDARLASKAGARVSAGGRRGGAVSVVAANSAAVATPSTAESGKALAKPTVLVAEKLGAAGIELLEKVAIVDCSYNLSPEDLCAKISLCDALIVRSGTKVTREVFEASKGRLKVNPLPLCIHQPHRSPFRYPLENHLHEFSSSHT
jgi:hypothetical protein